MPLKGFVVEYYDVDFYKRIYTSMIMPLPHDNTQLHKNLALLDPPRVTRSSSLLRKRRRALIPNLRLLDTQPVIALITIQDHVNNRGIYKIQG